MSARYFELVIPAGSNVSQGFDIGESGFRPPMALTFYAYADLVEEVILEVCSFPRFVFVPQKSGGQNIIIPGNGATTITLLNASLIRLRATAGGVPQTRTVDVLWNLIHS